MKVISKIMLACVLTVAFAAISYAGTMSQAKLSLKKGWNLVGSVLDNVDLESAFNQEYVSSVWAWDPDNNSWSIYSPDESIQELANKYQLKQMQKVNAGEGYWVNATEDAELYILGEPPAVTSTLSAASVDTDFAETVDTLDNESIDSPETVTPEISQLVANSEVVTYYGEVISVPEIGTKTMNGFQLKTADEEVTIYGLGPVTIWDSAEIDRPIAGDNITVEAFKITLDDGSIRNIAIKITDSDGNSLELRDDTTGFPVWAKGAVGFNVDPQTGTMKKNQYKWGKYFQTQE